MEYIYQISSTQVADKLLSGLTTSFKDKIKDLVNRGDIFNEDVFSKASYLVINPQDTEILVIDVGSVGDKPSIESGLEYLLCQLYKNLPVKTVFKGTTNAVQTWLGQEFDVNHDFVSYKNLTINAINWDDYFDNQAQWDDEDYVINKFLAGEKIDLMDVKLWNQASFVKKFLTQFNSLSHPIDIFSKIPEEVLLSKSFLEIAFDCPMAFELLLRQSLPRIVEYSSEPESITMYLDEMFKKAYSSESRVLKHNFLTSKDYHQYVSDEVKLKPAIIDKLIMFEVSGNNQVDIKTLLPKDLFLKEENWDQMIKVYLKIGNWVMINNSHDFMWSAWINDKQKVLTVLNAMSQHNNVHPMEQIFSHLSHDMMQSRSVVEKLVHSVPNLFWQIPNHFKSDERVLESYITSVKKTNFTGVEKTDLFKLQDLEVIKVLINKHPTLLEDKNCPAYWTRTHSVLAQAGLYLKCSDEKWQELNCDIEFLKVFIKNVPEHYLKLSDEVRKNPSLAIIYLKSIQHTLFNPKSLEGVPASLWCSTQFNLDLLPHMTWYIASVMEKIPKPLWSDKKLLLGVLTLLDTSKVTPKALDYLPLSVQKYLSENNIHQNRAQIIGNYIEKKQLKERLEQMPEQESAIKPKKFKV